MKTTWLKFWGILPVMAFIGLPRCTAQSLVAVETLKQFVAAFNAHDLQKPTPAQKPPDSQPSVAADPQAAVGTAEAPCTLLMGGGGTVTPDKDVNDHWFLIDSTVARNLSNSLGAMGYRIHDFIVDIQDADKRGTAMYQELRKTKCGKVVQLTHQLRGDGSHPGVVSKFAFVVSVLHLKTLEPDASGRLAAQVEGDYKKEYEYAMTSKIMQELSLSGLAKAMATDLHKAGVLEK